MNITVTDQGAERSIVAISGKLNMVSAARLRETVAAQVASGHIQIVVDLSQVEFIDSSGLGALISGLKAARQVGGDLRIAGPTDQVKLVLQLTNMERVLIAYDRADTAFENA